MYMYIFVCFQLKSVAASLSTRQLLRVAKRLAHYPDEELYSTIHRACLSQFLPRLARTALDEKLEALGISKPKEAPSVEAMDKAITCQFKASRKTFLRMISFIT